MGYMAPDLDFFPAALINDGLMDLSMINGDIGISKAFQIGKGLARGTYIDDEVVSYRKIAAYRVKPMHERGYLSIDGESYPLAEFQAEVQKGLARVICKRGVFEAPGPKGWQNA
jgi:sphingosine kinase